MKIILEIAHKHDDPEYWFESIERAFLIPPWPSGTDNPKDCSKILELSQQSCPHITYWQEIELLGDLDVATKNLFVVEQAHFVGRGLFQSCAFTDLAMAVVYTLDCARETRATFCVEGRLVSADAITPEVLSKIITAVPICDLSAWLCRPKELSSAFSQLENPVTLEVDLI